MKTKKPIYFSSQLFVCRKLRLYNTIGEDLLFTPHSVHFPIVSCIVGGFPTNRPTLGLLKIPSFTGGKIDLAMTFPSQLKKRGRRSRQRRLTRIAADASAVSVQSSEIDSMEEGEIELNGSGAVETERPEGAPQPHLFYDNGFVGGRSDRVRRVGQQTWHDAAPPAIPSGWRSYRRDPSEQVRLRGTGRVSGAVDPDSYVQNLPTHIDYEHLRHFEVFWERGTTLVPKTRCDYIGEPFYPRRVFFFPYSQCSHLNLLTNFPLKVDAQKV